jgi:hypothetical protein
MNGVSRSLLPAGGSIVTDATGIGGFCIDNIFYQDNMARMVPARLMPIWRGESLCFL